jgi:probable H4MPT-linked C1 transfer pathway protein
VPIVGSIPVVKGYGDASRLASGELVYAGVVRTPVMAFGDRIRFEGLCVPPMAEFFATAADVYRLTGELPRGTDQLPAADGGSKTPNASARRLARMIGRDAASAPLESWRRCARNLGALQLDTLLQACEEVASRSRLPATAPLVGAGIGTFVARKLARRARRRYVDFGRLAGGGGSPWLSYCAPAVAVAVLGQLHLGNHAGRQARR